MRRVVILGRGGAGKSTLAQDLSRRIGLPVAELDALFWRPGPHGPLPAEPAAWTTRQRELIQRHAWIIDGDLGPYDHDLCLRLRAADTVIVLAGRRQRRQLSSARQRSGRLGRRPE